MRRQADPARANDRQMKSFLARAGMALLLAALAACGGRSSDPPSYSRTSVQGLVKAG